MESEPLTLRSAYEYIKKELIGNYSDREIYSLGYLLLENIMSRKRHELMLYPSEIVSSGHMTEINRMLQRLKKGEPVQHILGYAEFCDLELKVTRDVLVPRPETEELVLWILELLRNDDTEKGQAQLICDIGTGSGCIALALKKALPGACLVGTDISPRAVEVARENASRHSLDVHFLLHDILSQEWPEEYPSPDIIVSNPPYIPVRERQNLEIRVLY